MSDLAARAASLPDFDDSACFGYSDYYANMTVQLGELIEGGFLDWSDESWAWEPVKIEDDQGNKAPDYAMRERICTMFNERYFWREISITPPGQWKQRVLYTIRHELVPKYEPMYQLEHDNALLWLADWNEYGKRRDIGSVFPETLLSGNSDYVSDGKDSQFETIHNGDTIDKYNQYIATVKSLDQAFVDELGRFFTLMSSQTLSVW